MKFTNKRKRIKATDKLAKRKTRLKNKTTIKRTNNEEGD